MMGDMKKIVMEADKLNKMMNSDGLSPVERYMTAVISVCVYERIGGIDKQFGDVILNEFRKTLIDSEEWAKKQEEILRDLKVI